MQPIPTETHHYTLTKKQLTILNLLYRYRFSTSELISQTIHINKTTIFRRLQLLMELNYIGRNYDNDDKVHGRNAVYYLLPEGIKTLKRLSKEKYSAKVLRNYGKNEDVTPGFIGSCLAVFEVSCMLDTQHGSNLQLFTKSQLAELPHFPKPLPDAYVQLKSESSTKQFFLDVLHEGDPFFLSTRKVMQYIEFVDDGLEEWKQKTKTTMPRVLLVCDSLSLQKRLVKKMRRAIADVDSRVLKFYITTTDELREDDAWHNMDDIDEVGSLGSML